MRIVVENGISTHEGTVCSSSIDGVVTAGSNDFVRITNSLIMVESGKLIAPPHLGTDCETTESHEFTPDLIQNDFVTIENERICVVGDGFSPDPTFITDAGSNTFSEVQL